MWSQHIAEMTTPTGGDNLVAELRDRERRDRDRWFKESLAYCVLFIKFLTSTVEGKKSIMSKKIKLVPGEQVDDLHDFDSELRKNPELYAWNADYDEKKCAEKRSPRFRPRPEEPFNFDKVLANETHQSIFRCADVHCTLMDVAFNIPLQKYGRKIQKRLRPLLVLGLKGLSLFCTQNEQNQSKWI